MRIVFFDIDCLRPDHLGCYGYKRQTSPAIDLIARDAIRFDNYYCASSPCLPSRAALFTGRYGINNGILSNFGAGAKFRIRNKYYAGPEPENEMFMRYLRANGCHTISISNFADRHNAFWFACGWEELHTPNLKAGWETAEEVNAVALDWLRRNAATDNYFLHINYWDAHRPYRMDASWADKFKNEPAPDYPDEKTIAEHQSLQGPFTPNQQYFENNISPWALMPGSISNRKDFEKIITGYDAAISYVDHYLAQVVDELKRQGAYDDTMIIISSDHGDAFGEHGIYSDHCMADECIHNIPLIIKMPGVVNAGYTSKSLLYNVDLAPTICDVLGIEKPALWDGKSFRQEIEEKSYCGREFLVWDCGLYAVQRAVRTKTHLMIRTYDDYGYNLNPIELYDMAADNHQIHNIRDRRKEIVEHCSRLLADWLQEQKCSGNCLPDPLDEILKERSNIDVKGKVL